MGYRHIVISDMLAPKEDELPSWFVTKYNKAIDFSGKYWRSYSENSRDTTFKELESDVQKLVKEMDLRSVQLVFFADEGGGEVPDVAHVYVTRDSIKESNVSPWRVMQ